MKKYSKRNLNNIENIFKDKTGVDITEKRNEKNRMSKAIDITVGVVFCLIAVSLFSYNGFSDINKEESASETVIESEQLSAVPELKVGKYYISGNTDGHYLEVFSDGTIQLRGVDYLEYAWVGNIIEGLSEEEVARETEFVKRQAKDYEKRYKYKVAQSNVGNMMIFTDWVEIDGQYFGSGCILVDENTIRAGNSIFVYRDETVNTSDEEYSYPIYMIKLRYDEWQWPTKSTMVSRCASDHINIAGFFGDEIYSVYDGVVSETGNDIQDGKYIIIKIDDKTTVKYYHLEEINVEEGQSVEKGKVIGKMGNTGQSTGPNLAFAVYEDGVAVSPLAVDKSVEPQ